MEGFFLLPWQQGGPSQGLGAWVNVKTSTVQENRDLKKAESFLCQSVNRWRVSAGLWFSWNLPDKIKVSFRPGLPLRKSLFRDVFSHETIKTVLNFCHFCRYYFQTMMLALARDRKWCPHLLLPLLLPPPPPQVNTCTRCLHLENADKSNVHIHDLSTTGHATVKAKPWPHDDLMMAIWQSHDTSVQHKPTSVMKRSVDHDKMPVCKSECVCVFRCLQAVTVTTWTHGSGKYKIFLLGLNMSYKDDIKMTLDPWDHFISV